MKIKIGSCIAGYVSRIMDIKSGKSAKYRVVTKDRLNDKYGLRVSCIYHDTDSVKIIRRRFS